MSYTLPSYTLLCLLVLYPTSWDECAACGDEGEGSGAQPHAPGEGLAALHNPASIDAYGGYLAACRPSDRVPAEGLPPSAPPPVHLNLDGRLAISPPVHASGGREIALRLDLLQAGLELLHPAPCRDQPGRG